MTIEQLQTQLQSILADLDQELNQAQIEPATLKNNYLGQKGAFTQAASQIKTIDDKKTAGQLINQFKNQLTEKLTSYQANFVQKTQVTQPQTDLTTPAANHHSGHLHPISQAIEQITQIFGQIGFQRVRHPEVDTDYFAFEALNMPPTHPARDEWETFFVHNPADPTTKNWVLTPHTSNGQVREMLRLQSQPPIRMINIGRCYRRQQDVTHTQMFHQFEGLVIDENINITHLKGVLDHFAHEFYGPDTKSRIRPFHFQFTEPSFEIDFSCHICHGTGVIHHSDTNTDTKCKFCKSGWHEVGGAGMVHPNVLKSGGLDPTKYTGFAFGWGIERTYTLKPDLNIDDIRHFYAGNLDFLAQF